MRKRLTCLVLTAFLLGCLLLCPSCALFRPTGPFALSVEYSDEADSIVLSVSGAPQQGVAGLFVEAEAMQFDPDRVLLTGIHGFNDFAILSHHFDNVEGKASVVAVNPTTGIRNGVVATITVLQVEEGDPGIVIDPTGIHLVDSHSAELYDFQCASN